MSSNGLVKTLVDTYHITPSEALKVIQGTPLEKYKTRWNSEILEYEFPDPKFILPGFITEGLNILGGRPKVGKSWLALQILKAVSTGTEMFGEEVKKRKSFYLALEDNPRRLQQRIKVQGWPSCFDCDFETKLPKKLDKGGIEWLRNEVEAYGFEFIVIDTISRALSSKIRQNDVGDTTGVYDGLQSLALEYDISIVLIDHFNKAKDADDVIDAISGSTGKTGVADTTLGIFKQRHYKSAQLKLTGRDVLERDLTIEWQSETCTWELLGETDKIIQSKADVKVLSVIEELGDNATLKNIIKETDWSKGYAWKRLKELMEIGHISQDGKGQPFYVNHSLIDFIST